MLASEIDWTAVIVAVVASVPGIIAAVLTYLVRREQRIPSGGTIGELAERTHNLAASAVWHGQSLLEQGGHTSRSRTRAGDPPPAEPKAGPRD